MRTIASLIILALASTACLGSDFEDSVEGSWQLEQGTLDGSPVPIVNTHPITMTLEGDEISGAAACNSYFGQWELSGNMFSIPEGLAWTEMACMPSEVMESESAYLDALLRVDTVTVDDATLTLVGDGTELTFSSVAPVES